MVAVRSGLPDDAVAVPTHEARRPDASEVARAVVLFFDLGQAATAEVLWSRALAVLRAKDPGSWEIAEAESRLGARLAAQGRYAEAEVCLTTSYETPRRLRGEEAIYTRAARRRLEELRSAHNPIPGAAGG